MKKLLLTLTLLTSAVLTSCGGGGGSTSTGGVHFTHEELADEFVVRLFTDVGVDATLVKSNTFQSDYVVVYDNDFGTYDAYFIGEYNVGEDLNNYLADYDSSFFYDLSIVSGTSNTYEDFNTGIQFEETAVGLKDLEKLGAIEQAFKNKKVAKKLATEFGLSTERSLQVAKLASQWKSISKQRSMTNADANALSVDLFGFDLSKIMQAQKEAVEGKTALKNQLMADAAEFNGNTPEAMNELVNYFVQ